MSLKNRLQHICNEHSDIQIESFDLEGMTVDVLLPYETTSISIELEGTDDDAVIESFKYGVNKRLDEMIDHLNDCKF